jgi:hypothetical protein
MRCRAALVARTRGLDARLLNIGMSAYIEQAQARLLVSLGPVGQVRSQCEWMVMSPPWSAVVGSLASPAPI